ncbi:MAG: hypothetical protein H0T86_00725 [Gemmatimonadales bacterium]|nr:hypothetical protein [Gemmatimonadales bacterium]
MRHPAYGLLLLGAAALAACQDHASPSADQSLTPSLAKAAPALNGSPTQRAVQIVERVNARLAAAGSTRRLDEVWMFSLGQGTDPFRRLRTGSRWVNPRSVTYSIDASDLIQYDPSKPGAPFTDADVLAALLRAHETYNQVRNIVLHSTRVADDGGNNDILDGEIRNANNECVDVVDLDADNLDSYDPATGALSFEPVADNLFGGWLAPTYFADCLGSEQILGVTWTFSDVDGALGDGLDGYRDRIYTEQFYNTRFAWVTQGSTFLGPTEDVESIVLHEVGHTHGLGHFGGPNANQPFKLQPNGRVFDPEAVMNPFYLGGEKHELLPTDLAGLRALYASKRLR